MESAIAAAMLTVMLSANPAESTNLDELEAQVQANLVRSRKYAVENTTRNASVKNKPLLKRSDLGIAASENFSILAPIGDYLAARVLKQSESLRKSIAVEWLGELQPAGAEFTIIHVEIADDKDEARLLLSGKTRDYPGKNRLWITSSRDKALGSTLAHEITHIVLATRFPKGMPVWANEGIASLQDDDQRANKRFELMKQIAKTGQWPSLHVLLNLKSIAAGDAKNYALAESLTCYLLSLENKQTFIQFIDDAMAAGWDRALQKHYRISGVPMLQAAWQNWVRQQVK